MSCIYEVSLRYVTHETGVNTSRQDSKHCVCFIFMSSEASLALCHGEALTSSKLQYISSGFMSSEASQVLCHGEASYFVNILLQYVTDSSLILQAVCIVRPCREQFCSFVYYFSCCACAMVEFVFKYNLPAAVFRLDVHFKYRKLFVSFLYFIGLVYCQQECSDPVITLNTVISTKISVFLRWQTDKFCSYSFEVTWYPEDDPQSVEHVLLDLDDTKLNATNLIPNTRYEFVVASNGSVRNFTFPIYTAPDEIKNLTATGIALNSINLSWISPTEGSGNGLWTEICVSMYESSEHCQEINGNEYRFTGLPSCTNHTFRITSIGYDAWNSTTKLRSSTITSIYQTLKTVPGVVTHLTAYPLFSSDIVIHWTPPIWYEAPDCVQYYNVSIYNDDFTTHLIAITTNHTLLGFDSCTNYKISVISIGEAGESTPTTTDLVKTGPMYIPDENIVINNIGKTWVEFSWTPVDVGSECVTDYWLFSIAEPPIEIPLRNFTANEMLTYNYTGLEPCDIKSIRIYSVNEEGTISPSTAKTVYTLGEDPGVITNLKVNFSGNINRYVEFSWTPVITSSKCGLLYRVCAHLAGSPEVYTCTHVTSDSHLYNFYTLNSCTRYTFNITWWAPFDLTFSTWSVSETIPAYYPYILNTVTARSSGYDTFVTWSYPYDYGTDCIQYFNVCWAIRYNDSCLQVENNALSVIIPERITNLFHITVTAVFNNGGESNTVYYFGNSSMVLQTSPVFIICGLIIQLVLKLCS